MLMYNFDLIVSDNDACLDLNNFFVWEITLKVNFNGIWQTVCQIVTVSGSGHSSKVYRLSLFSTNEFYYNVIL